MPKPKRNNIDLRILFQELDLALDKADFHFSKKLCDELIEVARELYTEEKEEGEEKSQEWIPKIRQ